MTEELKPFNQFNSFAQMVAWKESLNHDQLRYLNNIIKIDASKMKPPFAMFLNQKFKTERFDFLLLCLEYIYRGCEVLQQISYNPMTTELKRTNKNTTI